MKILVVSNEREFKEYIEDILGYYSSDWTLSVIDSGKQCIKAIKNNNGKCPDVILLDINLSDITCCNLIKMIRDNSDLPVVVLSNNKNLDVLAQVFNAGADDYIAKPFNKAIFVARLKALYRRRIWNTQALERMTDKPLLKK
jgi:DNA-binding response OmpR family regulator